MATSFRGRGRRQQPRLHSGLQVEDLGGGSRFSTGTWKPSTSPPVRTGSPARAKEAQGSNTFPCKSISSHYKCGCTSPALHASHQQSSAEPAVAVWSLSAAPASTAAARPVLKQTRDMAWAGGTAARCESREPSPSWDRRRCCNTELGNGTRPFGLGSQRWFEEHPRVASCPAVLAGCCSVPPCAEVKGSTCSSKAGMDLWAKQQPVLLMELCLSSGDSRQSACLHSTQSLTKK